MFKSTVEPQRAAAERLLDSAAVATEVAAPPNPIIPDINNSTLSNELDRSRQDGSYRTGPVAAWGTVFILLVIAILSYLDRGIISLMVGPLRKDLGISDFEIGLVQGVGFGVFYALFGLPVGYLVDKLPRRLIVYLGVTCWSFAAAACGLAQTFQQLLLARFGVGIGEASLSPAAYSMIADLFPPRRLAFAIGVFGVGTVLGSAVAFMGGGAVLTYFSASGPVHIPLLGDMKPWQMVFIVTGAPGLLLSFLIFLIPEPYRKLKGRQSESGPVIDSSQDGLITFLRTNWRFLTCHFLGFGFLAAATYGGLSWLPALLLRRFHISIGEVGLLMGCVSIFAGVPGFVWSGWIVDRWFAAGRTDAHQRYYAYVNCLAAVAAILIFAWAPSVLIVILGWAFVTFLQPFSGPSAAQLQIVTPPHLRGRVSAIYVMVFNLMGMCLGPPVVAFVTDFIFGRPEDVNLSLAVSYFAFAVLSAGAFIIGLGPSRKLIAQTVASK